MEVYNAQIVFLLGFVKFSNYEQVHLDKYVELYHLYIKVVNYFDFAGGKPDDCAAQETQKQITQWHQQKNQSPQKQSVFQNNPPMKKFLTQPIQYAIIIR